MGHSLGRHCRFGPGFKSQALYGKSKASVTFLTLLLFAVHPRF